jgi:hypothetical protein
MMHLIFFGYQQTFCCPFVEKHLSGGAAYMVSARFQVGNNGKQHVNLVNLNPI